MILGSAFRFNCKAVKSWLKFLCAPERHVKCWLHCWIISMNLCLSVGNLQLSAPVGLLLGWSEFISCLRLMLKLLHPGNKRRKGTGDFTIQTADFSLNPGFHDNPHLLLPALSIVLKSIFLYLKKIFYLFLIDWWWVYDIGLLSVIHQHELTLGVHLSPPSWISPRPPAHSHPSRLLQSPSLSSLSHIANSHWLSIYVC